ncbi:MAG: CHAD domain-containing protein [Spartobacteria bacterium]|nr:CHAD domain-containing protein [Spartobacteria bacterium]
MRIFDAVREGAGFIDQDRVLLECAALLHDIGYSTDPPNHAAVSADIVLNEGVQGLTRQQCQLVAAVVRLHQRNIKKALGHPVFSDVAEEMPRLKKLAAVLRVADGLDHGHIQDTVITAIKPARKYCTITIRSGWYKGNLAWAEAKGDVWNEAMPWVLRWKDVAPFRSRTDYRDVVTLEDSPVGAARKLLYAQYRIIMENREAILCADESPDPEYLHDLRVALRRFRAALDLFEGPLRDTGASAINSKLDALGDELGPIRDSNVWVDFLCREAEKEAVCNDPVWPEFYRGQCAADAVLNGRLRVILARDSFNELINSLVRFLKSELPALMRMEKKRQVCVFGARRLLDVFERIEAYRKTMDYSDSEQMHTLRKLCRKERYWTEFLTPVLKGPSRLLGRQLKKIADALGDVHDMDVHLGTLATSEPEVPFALIAHMKRRRIHAGKMFHRAWSKLTDKPFRKNVDRHLQACRKKGE